MSGILIRLHLLFVFILFCRITVQAQETNDLEDLTAEDYMNLTLPPLDVLFENAKNSPTYESAEVAELIERRNLNKEKRAFLSFFSLRGSYQYGTFSNDGSYTDVYTQPIYTYNKTTQNLYSVGAGVNIPLDQLFDLGARVKRQKLTVKLAELKKEQAFETLKREIVSLYTTAIAQLNVLKLRAEAVVLSNAQYAITEKGFVNGTIDSAVLASEKEKQSMSKQRFEDSKFKLNESLLILEIITHTPIIKK